MTALVQFYVTCLGTSIFLTLPNTIQLLVFTVSSNASQVRIPAALVSKLIGERGKTISEICRDSKTKISVPRIRAGDQHVVISVHGDQEDIKIAQYLMQKTLKGNRWNYLTDDNLFVLIDCIKCFAFYYLVASFLLSNKFLVKILSSTLRLFHVQNGIKLAVLHDLVNS